MWEKLNLYDVIRHDMAVWTYPTDHFRFFNQGPKIRVLEKLLCRDDGSVRGISGGSGSIWTTHDVLPQSTFHSISTNH